MLENYSESRSLHRRLHILKKSTKELVEYSGFNLYARAPFISGHDRLSAAVDVSSMGIIERLGLSLQGENIVRGDILIEPASVTDLWLLTGPPGVGKTTLAQKIEYYQRQLSSTMGKIFSPIEFPGLEIITIASDDLEDVVKEVFLAQQDKLQDQHKRLNVWYELLEKSQIDPDFIENQQEMLPILDQAINNRPQYGTPYPDEYLSLVNTLLEWRIAYESSKNIPFKVIIAQLLSLNAIKYLGEWRRHRHFPDPIFENISRRQGTFATIPVGSLFRNYVGLVPAPPTDFFNYFRDAVRLANSLGEANEVCRIFGKTPFNNDQEWKEATVGGTMKQVKYSLDEARLLAREAIQAGIINKLDYPDLEKYIFDVQASDSKDVEQQLREALGVKMITEIRFLAILNNRSYKDQLQETLDHLLGGKIYKNIFEINPHLRERDSFLNKPPNNYFIGYPDPNFLSGIRNWPEIRSFFEVMRNRDVYPTYND